MKSNHIDAAKKEILLEQFEKAKEILRPLAQENNSEAQLILGYLYYGGDPDTSGEEAEYWFGLSAENGNAKAMYYLSTTNFKDGRTSSEPESESLFALLLQAAEKGSVEAQRSLAVSYAHGEIVPQDDQKTMYWDEQAANQGSAESQFDLAQMLLGGYQGGVPNIEKAIFWFEQSASKDFNVPYAQWAAEALAGIYSSEMDATYTDAEKSKHWKDRALYLDSVAFRDHPNWFYESLSHLLIE